MVIGNYLVARLQVSVHGRPWFNHSLKAFSAKDVRWLHFVSRFTSSDGSVSDMDASPVRVAHMDIRDACADWDHRVVHTFRENYLVPNLNQQPTSLLHLLQLDVTTDAPNKQLDSCKWAFEYPCPGANKPVHSLSFVRGRRDVR